MSPVMVGIYVPDDSLFEFYSGGVWPANSCMLPTGAPSSARALVNHALLVVGYDMTIPGNHHWIVKNSYGRGCVTLPVQAYSGRLLCRQAACLCWAGSHLAGHHSQLAHTSCPLTMHRREEWGEDGFGRIAMMPDNTYGTCFMYYVRTGCDE